MFIRVHPCPDIFIVYIFLSLGIFPFILIHISFPVVFSVIARGIHLEIIHYDTDYFVSAYSADDVRYVFAGGFAVLYHDDHPVDHRASTLLSAVRVGGGESNMIRR